MRMGMKMVPKGMVVVVVVVVVTRKTGLLP
jgi:hypothetical protein